jgi:outer membrane receptor for ferrienterochelin and colicins
MRVKTYILISLVISANIIFAQQEVDTLINGEIQELIVTATRNERHLSNVIVPATLINQRQIQLSGTLRLNEILQEQTGLFVTSGTGSGAVGGGVFGNGVQIQGLNPDYTLILLDGEPLIGRQGGVMDLSRFTIGNIQKIEVIKGPASALYGSEAMGGVVNIITEQKRQNYTNGAIRYGSFNSKDIYASGNLDHKRSTLYLFANYNDSDGYDLSQDRPERTIDPFHNLTFQAKWTWRATERLKLIWNNRYFYGYQQSSFAVNSENINVVGAGITKDININPTINYLINDKLKTSTRLYASMYQFAQNLVEKPTETAYYVDNFAQNFYRIENQTDWTLKEGHHAVFGGGYNLQTVETIRYRTKKYQHLTYVFAQYEWKPNSHWLIIPGLRYDVNSDFSNRLSPKLAAQYKPNKQTSWNFSYGAGFKAPDFRQLYLYYINNPLGYQLFGASEFSLNDLLDQQEQGLIARILPEAYQITQLRPEYSHGFNAGTVLTHSSLNLKAEINFFANLINDLINYVPVAVNQNGNFIFSYLNVRRAYTAGTELNLSGKVFKDFDWVLGYQYLNTGDIDLINNIRKGEVFGRNTQLGSARPMRMRDYSGLLGRSPHMLQARILYTHKASGWGGSMRAIYRNKWGITDLDGNGFANMNEEFARGFCQLNFSVQKSFHKRYTAQLAFNNLLNHIDPINAPQLPGTNLTASFIWNVIN